MTNGEILDLKETLGKNGFGLKAIMEFHISTKPIKGLITPLLKTTTTHQAEKIEDMCRFDAQDGVPLVPHTLTGITVFAPTGTETLRADDVAEQLGWRHATLRELLSWMSSTNHPSLQPATLALGPFKNKQGGYGYHSSHIGDKVAMSFNYLRPKELLDMCLDPVCIDWKKDVHFLWCKNS